MIGFECEGSREDRRRHLQEVLGRNRVWFHDDPGVAEIMLDLQVMHLLDAIRRSSEPQCHASLVDAGFGPLRELTLRLDRLEAFGMICHHAATKETPSGFLAVDNVLCVFHDGTQAALEFFGRYRAMVSEFNDGMPIAVEEERADSILTDRVFMLTPGEYAHIEAALYRACRECRALEDRIGQSDSEEATKTPIRVMVRMTKVACEGPLLAPLAYFDRQDLEQAESTFKAIRGRLTPRQNDIASLLLDGSTAAAVSEKLGISVNTVKSAIREIYKRVGVSSKAEFVQRMTD